LELEIIRHIPDEIPDAQGNDVMLGFDIHLSDVGIGAFQSHLII
jgi:hypothetical protein